MAPIVHGLEAQYNGRINFVYLDIDDPANNGFKETLGYGYQPHFFLIDGEGIILNQWIGPVEEAELTAALEASLGQ
ncbi:MAG TPA: hypothetical protein VJ436_07015 [Anaerolineales bacterium]|nr:hypothetical protein [Anaerolineales bacterium]